MGNCVSLFLSFVYISFRLVSALSVFPTLVIGSNLNCSFKTFNPYILSKVREKTVLVVRVIYISQKLNYCIRSCS